jgi:serine protease Do
MRTWIVLMGSLLQAASAAAAGLVVDPAVLKAEADRVAVIAKAKDAVLAVFSASGGGGGSGVVISPDGFALTNFHVAQPSGNAMKCGMPDGRLYDAVIVGIDPVGDVALIKLFGRDDFPHAQLGDSDRVQAGDPCYAMGNPFLLASDFHPTLTHGIVSGVHRYQYPSGTLLEYADCLQTDASINPGNSGGPLFDAEGRLIGINGRASFEKRGRVNVGIAYAISINQIKNFLGHLKSGRIVDHATLGAVIGFDADRRPVVSDILDTSDAYRRGLRYGDEIVAFAGRAIDSPNAFKNVLGTLPKGWQVPLSFRREGKRFDVLVRLAGVHTEEGLLAKLSGRARPAPMPVPKPGEKPVPEGQKPEKRPQEKKPGDHDDDGPAPGPLPEDGPAHAMRPKAPIPEIVKKHFEQKRGYANYYYNRLNRDRVWKAMVAAQGDMGSPGRSWSIAGPLDGGGRYRIEISDAEVLLKVPTRESKWTASDEITSSLTPEGSGGLFPAIYLWRRLIVAGPEKFGEVYYLGAAPMAGQPDSVDVLVGLHGGAECRFSFDSKTGLLLAMEMFPEANADPCEVRFSDYAPIGGRNLPHRMVVRYGGQQFATFKIDLFSLDKPMQP